MKFAGVAKFVVRISLGLLVWSASSVAHAHEVDRIVYLRCDGTDDNYHWRVSYRLAINLDTQEVTSGSGKILTASVFNDGVIIVWDDHQSVGNNVTSPPVDTRITLNIERSGLRFIAYEVKGRHRQEPIFRDNGRSELLPSAIGLCIIQSGF